MRGKETDKETKKKIIKLRKEGNTIRTIAKLVGVSKSAVGYICKENFAKLNRD